MAYINTHFLSDKTEHLHLNVFLYDLKKYGGTEDRFDLTIGMPGAPSETFRGDLNPVIQRVDNIRRWFKTFPPYDNEIWVQLYMSAKTHCLILTGEEAVKVLIKIKKGRDAGKPYGTLYSEIKDDLRYEYNRKLSGVTD